MKAKEIDRHMATKPLPYYGGKHKLAPWISSLLPARNAYCEPFAGMLSVLLSRRPSTVEAANDLDGDIVNWWRMVRDRPDDLAEKVVFTPWSLEEFKLAKKLLLGKKGTPLRRAWATHVMLEQGFGGTNQGSWGRRRTISSTKMVGWGRDRFVALAERLKRVQLDRISAVDFLERWADVEDVALYCDPPYHTANTDGYGTVEVDVEDLTKALLAQKGSCAVSGFGDEWDHLGWRKETMKHATKFHSRPNGERMEMERTEAVWLNFDSALSDRSLLG